ncbi:MAG TPA: ABC transporter substrate-binding protein, partial [Anaerolineales bacterium]|nr:ABC transporter substrate-binding protein [Anaerolineales bacterium]
MNNYMKFLKIVIAFLCSLIISACATPVSSSTSPEQELFAPAVSVTTETPPAQEDPAEPEVLAAQDEPTAVFEPFYFSAPDCEYGGLLKSIEAVDILTVKFTMCAPDPVFLAKVAFSAFAIHSADYLEQTGGGGEGSALLEAPIGTGPYKVAEWKRGDELVFTANPDYWNPEEAAKTPTLVFRWSS